MKKRLITWAALLLWTGSLLMALTGCGGDATLREIRRNGALRVGYASCAPSEDAPFLLDSEKGLTGQPAVKAAKTLDVKAEFVRLTPDKAYDALLQGNVDCLWNIPAPGKRTTASVRTIETGLYSRQVIMTTADSSITRLADVSGKVMAVVSGSDAQTELHNASVMESSLKEIRIYTGMREVMAALTNGEAHCAAVDEPQALYAAREAEGAFRTLETPIAEKSLVIACRAEDGELCSRIAERFVKMVQNGEIQSLCDTYLPDADITHSHLQNQTEGL